MKRSVTVSALGGVSPCPACTLLRRSAISVVIAHQTYARMELQATAKEVSESDWPFEAACQAVEAMMAGVAGFYHGGDLSNGPLMGVDTGRRLWRSPS